MRPKWGSVMSSKGAYHIIIIIIMKIHEKKEPYTDMVWQIYSIVKKKYASKIAISSINTKPYMFWLSAVLKRANSLFVGNWPMSKLACFWHAYCCNSKHRLAGQIFIDRKTLSPYDISRSDHLSFETTLDTAGERGHQGQAENLQGESGVARCL